VRRLVKAAARIKRVFGGKDQDIEWIYMRGQIYIVQARPFVALRRRSPALGLV
jgi:phosphoenolpyruvate synthase/pyruvate phosphate dikinase